MDFHATPRAVSDARSLREGVEREVLSAVPPFTVKIPWLEAWVPAPTSPCKDPGLGSGYFCCSKATVCFLAFVKGSSSLLDITSPFYFRRLFDLYRMESSWPSAGSDNPLPSSAEGQDMQWLRGPCSRLSLNLLGFFDVNHKRVFLNSHWRILNLVGNS